MERIKVLHIAQANGGVAEYLKMFMKYSDKILYEVELLCSKCYEAEKLEFKKLNVKVEIIDMGREIKLSKDLKASIDIYKYIKKSKPDIVYAHSSKAGALSRIPAFLSNTPIIYNAHGWAFDMNVGKRKKAIFVVVEKFLARLTSKIINISFNDEISALKYKIGTKKKNCVIENGIDLEKYNQTFNRKNTLNDLGIPENALVIGMVARISEQKSPSTFLKIAKIISEKIPNSYFILVGDGEDRRKIEKEAYILGIKERLRVTGWVKNVPEYINCFDIALLTSKWEGFGLAIIEYFISKKPVIASNVGGIKNIIENHKNGILIDDLDSEEFSKAILMLYDNKDFRISLIENAYFDAINKYDMKFTVNKHEKIFKEILNSHKNMMRVK